MHCDDDCLAMYCLCHEYVRIPQWLLEAMYRESSRIMSYAVIPTSSLSFIGVCTSAGLLLQEKISS